MKMANPITKIKAIKDFVEDILLNYPLSRDNDNYLACFVWHKQVRASRDGDVTFENFLTMYSNGMLASSDTITRAARKIKETRPDLRGNGHNKRKKLEVQTRLTINKL
jgi:hypothetical protein